MVIRKWWRKKYCREAMWAVSSKHGRLIWPLFNVWSMHKGLENIPRCQLESRCKPNPVWIDGWTTIPTGYYITLLSILVNKLWCGWRSLQSCSLSLGTCLLFVQLINLRIISVESHLHQMEHHDSQSYQVHKIVSLFVPNNYCQRLILYNHHLTMTNSTATCSHHASALFIYLFVQ